MVARAGVDLPLSCGANPKIRSFSPENTTTAFAQTLNRIYAYLFG